MPSEATTPSFSTTALVLRRLRELVDQPWLLVCVLLAASALARPYANVMHDARLYTVQVLNHVEHGTYDNDLFFRFGSQDQYSVFSLVMAPLVRLLGLKLAFFVAYLVSNAIYIVGVVALMRVLVKDRLLALVSMAYLAIAPLEYCAFHVFHVHESFLTPRLSAVGMVLLGLAKLLEGRLIASLGCMIVAGLLHPLMAAGGFLMWGGVCMVDKLGWRWALSALTVSVLAVAAFLATPAVASRLLGEMDGPWRDSVLRSTSFNFMSEWEIRDWGNVVFSFVSIVGGIWVFRNSIPREQTESAKAEDRRRASFVMVAGLVGVAAVLGTLAAQHLPYALPIQGQPYRALWILKVLQAPLGFVLADRLLRSGNLGAALFGFVPLGFLLSSGPTNLWRIEWTWPLYFLPFAILVVRGLAVQPQRSDWLLRSLAVSLLLGELAWCVNREVVTALGAGVLFQVHDAFAIVFLLLFNVGVLPWLVLFFVAALGFLPREGSMRRFALASLALAFIVQTAHFAIPNVPAMREIGTHYLSDIQFARDFVRQQRQPGGKTPTIYSPFGRVELVWLDMGMNSYFDWCQNSGVIFRRQTALEGQRRATLVGPFAMEHYRLEKDFFGDEFRRKIERLFERELDSPEATLDDLAQLCQEQDLDYLVLRHQFGNLYAATNGSVYIYDCRQLRAALGRLPHGPGLAAIHFP